MLALAEPAGFHVADATGQRDGLGEIHSHLIWRVRVGAEGDRDLSLPRKLQQFRAWVNFTAFFSQSGGVQLDGASSPRGRGDKFFVKRTAILRGADAEFFRQIRVADDLKQF